MTGASPEATARAAQLDPRLVDELVRRALEEDLGDGGDITTQAVVPPDLAARGRLVAREDGVLAGVEVAIAVFHRLDAECRATARVRDGEAFRSGRTLLEVDGRAAALLSAERVALNFLARLSGIATATRRMVEAVAGTPARITCTRKTTPGLRQLEKYAVRCGGGDNHRFGLYDAVLIKDNHIAAAGGVAVAVRQARDRFGAAVPIEVEVEELADIEPALAAGADVLLLDNMPVVQLRRAVRRVAGAALLEASGGVTLDTVREIAAAGVDRISVGALTHSARALDLSMEMAVREPLPPSDRRG